MDDQYIYITVRMRLRNLDRPGTDPYSEEQKHEIVEEMEYSIQHPLIAETEIVAVEESHDA